MNLSPYLILGLVLLVALYFIFRKKKVAIQLLSSTDKALLNNNVDYYSHLGQTKKLLFEQKLMSFLAAVKIEGVGLEITPLDRLLVASSAVIRFLVLKIGNIKT